MIWHQTRFLLSEIHQGYVQRCRRSPRVPGPSALEQKEISASFTGSRGAFWRGPLPVPSPKPLPPSWGQSGLPCTPSTSSWPAAEGGDPEQEHSLLHLQSQRNVCRSDMFQLIPEERKFLQLETAEIQRGAGARSRRARLPAGAWEEACETRAGRAPPSPGAHTGGQTGGPL